MDAAALKPSLRGVVHQWAFVVAVALAITLILTAPAGRGLFSALVYGLGVCGLFGISALYHRLDWRPRAALWMRRLDHSMIFVFIAATYTPIALIVLDGATAVAILSVVWSGALAGVILSLVWLDHPRWLSAVVYVSLGWVAIAVMPILWRDLGWPSVVGLAGGGVLYTLGAVVYARQRPDPVPQVFGFHEVFHVLVVAAAAAHFAVIAFGVMPRAS